MIRRYGNVTGRMSWNAGGILDHVSIDLEGHARPVRILDVDDPYARVDVQIAPGIHKVALVFCGPAAPLPAKLWSMEPLPAVEDWRGVAAAGVSWALDRRAS